MAKQNNGGIAPYRPLELMLNEDLTKFDVQDFIAVWDGFVPKAFCDQLIEYGDRVLDDKTAHSINVDAGDGMNIMKGDQMYGGKHNRLDKSFMLNYHSERWGVQVNQFLKSCAMHYVNYFSQLRNVTLVSSDIKFQRTPPGGGYHLWHYENAATAFAQRELVWMIYLNDVEDGGETEFQFQKRRIKPKAGTVVFFPAGLTHVHRGNMVLGETNKYIVTGWYVKSGS